MNLQEELTEAPEVLVLKPSHWASAVPQTRSELLLRFNHNVLNVESIKAVASFTHTGAVAVLGVCVCGEG